MKAKSTAVKLRARAPEYVLGVDGGGTKTHAALLDAHGRMLGEGFAGPSNPLRVRVGRGARGRRWRKRRTGAGQTRRLAERPALTFESQPRTIWASPSTRRA